MNILIINGPNLNMLGIREPEIYGKSTYQDLEKLILDYASKSGDYIEIKQSNYEGEIIDFIQQAYSKYEGIIINPAAYTHTSIAILDALKSVGIPYVEVHISDINKREEFRKISYIRESAKASVIGKGFDGYIEAIEILKR